jgi:4-diphosphocytidyl-2-C-methyl-D-erythritol kinase
MIEVQRTPSGVAVRSPAKLNLFLEVLGKRADGFHELETLMVPVNLYDLLEFAPADSGEIELACERFPSAGKAAEETSRLPEGSDNLVVRAVRLLADRAGVQAGARMKLWKRIPVAAGMAGGSSDAAAALLAANAGWRLDWPRERLLPLAAELGSDVPFFLGTGPAVCRGRGERIERTAGLGHLHFVVVAPPVGLSTAAVFRCCRPALAPRPLAPLLEALRAGDLPVAGRSLFNRLEPAAAELSPWIERLRNEFAQSGFIGHQMSGSGTSYFGLCHNLAHARRAASRLRGRRVGEVYAVRTAC